jgi:hypothetical protein
MLCTIAACQTKLYVVAIYKYMYVVVAFMLRHCSCLQQLLYDDDHTWFIVFMLCLMRCSLILELFVLNMSNNIEAYCRMHKFFLSLNL